MGAAHPSPTIENSECALKTNLCVRLLYILQESLDWKRKHEKFTKHRVELSWSRKDAMTITTSEEETAMSNHDHVSRESAGLTDLGEVACSRPAVSGRNCASVGSLSDPGESVSPRMSVRER